MSITKTKVSRSVALDAAVAERADEAAKAENRSFSNYVETLLAKEIENQTASIPKPETSAEGTP